MKDQQGCSNLTVQDRSSITSDLGTGNGIFPWNSKETWGQGYKTFYRGNLPPFHGNTVILCYKAILPWKLLRNGSKLPQYFNLRKSRVRSTVVIYRGIVL
jgi:hypothetical protein